MVYFVAVDFCANGAAIPGNGKIGAIVRMKLRIDELEKIIRQAGGMLLCAHVSAENIEHKQGDANFVTDYDVRIQRFLVTEFRKLIPDAAIFGEEETEENQQKIWSDGYTFIIDPIDGTTNFMFGYHHSCVSVGVALDGKLVLGCVYNPYVDEMYTAGRGEGAYLNGRRLLMKDLTVGESIISFGCARYNEGNVDLLFDVVKELFQRSLSVRCGGSAALDLCRVASGNNGAYLELRLNPYDYAAAALIIEESGGCIAQMDGSPITLEKPCSVLAGTKKAVQEIRELIREKS